MKTLLMFLALVPSTLMAATGKKATLAQELKLNPAEKVIKVLASPSFKVIGLGFKQGQVLAKHQTPTPAILIVQTGSVEFKMSGETQTLKAGDFFEIPAKIDHEVVGLEDSLLYLIK